MDVVVRGITKCKVDIEPEEAFKILCATLLMPCVCDESHDYYVSSDGVVWRTVNGRDESVDDRGELFIAFRNVAVNLFPNVIFRNDPYIYNRENKDVQLI